MGRAVVDVVCDAFLSETGDECFASFVEAADADFASLTEESGSFVGIGLVGRRGSGSGLLGSEDKEVHCS